MSAYYTVSGLIVPNGTIHYEFEWDREKDVLNQVTVRTPYPPEVEQMLLNAIARDSSSTVPGARPDGFFGKWNYSNDSTPKPPPVLYTKDVKDQPETVGFEREKNSGTIVMNPATLIQAELEWEPVEKPEREFTSVSFIPNKGDFKGLTTPFPGSNNMILLSNGRWYEPTSFKVKVIRVLRTTWSQPPIDLEAIFNKITFFEQDGGLITQAGANLNEATFDLLTEMAELPETLAMARDALSLFSNKGKKVRKAIAQIANESGSLSGLAKIGDRVASARLMYRYAIMPLKYTVDDIKELLKKEFKSEYVAGSERKSITDVPELDGLTYISGGYSQDHRAFFKRRLDPNSSLDQFQAVFGVNPPLTLWELTPWSLVVDWAINVGDYLQAINPMPSVQEAGCYSCHIGFRGTYRNKDGNILKVKVNYYNRNLINRILDSSLQFNPVLTKDRALDAFAFSWQIIRGKLKKLKK